MSGGTIRKSRQYRIMRCVLNNNFRHTIKLIMADVGQIGVSREQSRRCLVVDQNLFKERWNAMFNSRDFLRVEHNVSSKNITRDVRQSEKTLSEVI
jgi:hypothetical protein